jgi:hypothetical protein
LALTAATLILRFALCYFVAVKNLRFALLKKLAALRGFK